MAIRPSSKSKFLFIGDSITDCGWRDPAAQGIGDGYVRLIRDYLAAKDPATAPIVVNRGIGGHKVTDLQERWQRDVLDEKPDVLSIMVGINDVWHNMAGLNQGVSIEQYAQSFHVILRQVQFSLPQCSVVLCEPTVIWSPADETGNKLLQPYVRAVHEVAREFRAAAIVPTHTAFARAREARPDIIWAPDGVHPGTAGHMLIARTWLAATALL